MDKLVDEITEYLQNYPPAFEVFSRLIDIGDIYVMGGILREYRDRGKIKDIRDADISILIHDFDAWNRLISEIPNKINRFGGYKFLCSGLVVDVWNVKDTWAFKEGLVSVCNDDYFSTLPQSVFLNIDSICYDLKRDIWIDEKYTQAMKSRTLDIVLKENPFIELNIIRSMILKRKYDMVYSDELRNLICENDISNQNYANILYEAEMDRYGYDLISHDDILNELHSLVRNAPLE